MKFQNNLKRKKTKQAAAQSHRDSPPREILASDEGAGTLSPVMVPVASDFRSASATRLGHCHRNRHLLVSFLPASAVAGEIIVVLISSIFLHRFNPSRSGLFLFFNSSLLFLLCLFV